MSEDRSWRLPLGRMEPVLVAVAAPLLLFPRGPLPWVGLGLLLLGWTLRGFAAGKWLVRTPLDGPIAIIFLMTVASLYPSLDLSMSLPKFYGILLGLFVFYATVSSVSSRRSFYVGVCLLIAGVVAIALLGLVGTEWSTAKFSLLKPVYSSIPRVIRGIQTSVGPATGFNPNELGGALAFLLPVPLALLLGAGLSIGQRGILVAAVLIGFGVLGLSQSRSALVGLCAALLAISIWRWRRVGVGALLVGIATLAVIAVANQERAADFLLRMDVAADARSIASRVEIWDRARYMIEDFPFTGIGLNTFPIVLPTLYPLFLSSPGQSVPHTHNIFLQTAVDLGLGGLLGFLGLMVGVAHVGWRVYRYSDALVRAATAGMLAGLLAYLAYGLTDAITLGAKPTVLLWLMMGLVVAAQRLAEPGIAQSDFGGSASSVEAMSSPSVSYNELQKRRGGRPCPPWGGVGFSRRATSLLFSLLVDSYYVISFFLVGMAYLVVGMGISGWTP